MKVALVHDYIKEYGGAEKVLENLHLIFPDAPIFTTVYLPKYLGPHKKRFEGFDIRPSVFQYLPFKSKLISPMRLVAPLIFKSMDLSSYDLIITSATGAYNPNLVKKGKAKLICYCHTPPRYLYGYLTARDWKKNKIFSFFAEIANHFLRQIDFVSAQNVDQFIANSREVAARIKKFYKKESIVVYPPVDIKTTQSLFKNDKDSSGNYYLAGGRLARPKRIDLAVLACTNLNLSLKVFGKDFAGYGEELKKIAGPTIEFLGEVSDEEKWKLMRGAKAFIFPSDTEDFGIVPVEAMSVGTPVIAYRSGGVVESVVEGKTGVFFDNPTKEDLIKAIKKLDSLKIKPEDCKNQSRKFSSERFKIEIGSLVNKYAQKTNKTLQN